MINYLQIEQLSKSYGELVLFNNLSFSIEDSQRIGLIGKNGCGKTSLLNIIAGKDTPDSGNIVVYSGIEVGYLEQDPQYPSELTVLQACFHSSNETVQVIAEYEKLIASGKNEGLDRVLAEMERLKAWDYEQRAKQILSQLKIHNFDQKIGELSGGQLKRVALANVLIKEPSLLILDEPTNHLDLEMTEWLEVYLQRSRTSLLMVTHDRYFLDRVCSDILEIDNKQAYRYKGNYSYYLEKREERIAQQNSEIDRASNLLRKELEWMRRQPQARATKAKSRIDAFYDLEEKAKREKVQGNVKLEIKGSYIGTKIFEAKHVCKSYGRLKILEDFNYIFSRYEKMGIIGNNGTGKSTFIKMLVGKIAPDSGEFDVGETVKFGYYSQDGLTFNEEEKVIDIVKNIAEVIDLGNGRVLTASQFLQHFLFEPSKQHSFVGKLSGGERRRLYLCTVLMSNPNFLVLDEPTNDLDIVTLNVLEEYLQSFRGCVIVVSHDRYFMDKTVDHVLAFKGNADLKDFPGNYTDYREWKEEQDNLEKQQKSKEKQEKPKQDIPKTTSTKKLSYKDQRELEMLEQEIAEMEKEKTSLEDKLNSGFLTSEELMKQSSALGNLIDSIDEKTLRWLELNEKNE